MMPRWQAWLFHLSSVMVSGSGIAYFMIKHFMKSDDPFSVVNHPFQPTVLKIHILTAPLLVLGLGLIFSMHIVGKLQLRTRPNRISGLLALASFPAMVISGYILQVLTDTAAIRFVMIVHCLTGGLFALTYIVHQVGSIFLVRAYGPAPRNDRTAP